MSLKTYRPILAWSVAIGVVLTLSTVQAGEKPRYLVRIDDVRTVDPSKCDLREPARKLVGKLLAADPRIAVVEAKAPTPSTEALKRQKQQAYGMAVRITRCTHELHPPASGKVYKTLMVEVATAVDAQKIPSGTLARAGEGNAQVGTETHRIKPKELASLRQEALASALQTSITKFIATLDKKKDKKRRKRRRKRRRSSGTP